MSLIPSPNESLVKFYGPIGAWRVLKLRAAFVPQHEAWHKKSTGWWFGTCFFLYIYILRITIPTDLHIFQRGRYTTNQNNLWQLGWVGVTAAVTSRWPWNRLWGALGMTMDDLNFIPIPTEKPPFQRCPRRYKTLVFFGDIHRHARFPDLKHPGSNHGGRPSHLIIASLYYIYIFV